MKRRRGADAGEEALSAAARKKRQKKIKNKGVPAVEAAATRFSAGKEEKAEDRAVVGKEMGEEHGFSLPGGGSDVCQALMDRYARSSAPQHGHLCASAAAMRSILLDEGLPLTPPAYFAAAIMAICDADRRDRDALSALSAFLSVLLSHVPVGSVSPHKAKEAAFSLVVLLEEWTPESAAAPTVRSLVGSLGLLVQCVDLDDWSAVELPLRTLLRFSVDGRPKVRRCAQMSVEKVFRTFKSSPVVQKASKIIFSLFQSYLPLAVELSSLIDYSKSKNLEKSKLIELLHMLNVMKLIVPSLSQKILRKSLSDLYKLFSFPFSLLTRHVLALFEVLVQHLKVHALESEAENIISILTTFLSSDEKNPVDTLLSASTLLKDLMNRLHTAQASIWIKYLSIVFSSVAGLLMSEPHIAKHAAEFLRELISRHIDWHMFLPSLNESCSDLIKSPEACVIMSICTSCENVLSASSSIPNEHILAVISDLFLKLGENSPFFTREIVSKLSLWVRNADGDLPDVQHVKECLGSAIISMGPEKMLSMIPISLDTGKQTCLNTWLIPILKKYTVGASLQFFVEYIVPLAKSVQELCDRVQRSPTKKNLLSCVDGLWSLLPAFCHYPTDTTKHFDSLAKVMVEKLKKDPSSHEHVAAALKELVDENKCALKDKQEADNIYQSTALMSTSFTILSRSSSFFYTQKVARRNIKALTSRSMELFKTLTDIFFDSPPEKRTYLKEAIECLASILDSTNVQRFFLQSLGKLGLIDNIAGPIKDENQVQLADTYELGRNVAVDKIEEHGRRRMMMELVFTFVEGADKDFISIIFNFIKPYLLATDGACQCEAYQTLNRIFKGHSWFVLAQADQLMDLLLGLDSPVDLRILRCRLSCLHFMFVHLLKSNWEKTNTKALLILNEILRFVKDSREEVRKSAYDTLFEISCSLKDSMPGLSQSHHRQLFEMITGYFSGSPPRMMSAAITALSLLIYKDANLYFSVPNLMPYVSILFEKKANEVIKAVLGLVKVLVCRLQATEIRKLLPDIVNGIMQWSPVSKHHFRSKVRTIVEIMARKCGIDTVLSVVPDKFKGFIKTITEKSHGKANLTDIANSKTTTGPVDSTRRKSSGLSNRRNVERQCKNFWKHSGTLEVSKKKGSHKMEPSKHSGRNNKKNLLNMQKRKFEDVSWSGGKHSRAAEDSSEGEGHKKEVKEPSRHSGKSGSKQLIAGHKRKFEDGSSLSGKQFRTLKDSQKGQSHNREPRTKAKNKRRRMHWNKM